MGVHANSTATRIADLLSIEGGWWRCDEIADRLGAHPKTVDKALRRMAARGQVRKRMFTMAVANRFQEVEAAEWSV